MEQAISISEARKRLPQLVREIQQKGFMRYRLLVHGKTAAEIGPPRARSLPASRSLLSLRKKAFRLLRRKKIPRDISRSVDKYLYGLGPVSS